MEYLEQATPQRKKRDLWPPNPKVGGFGGKRGVTTNWHQVSLGIMKCSKIDVFFAQFCDYSKSH